MFGDGVLQCLRGGGGCACVCIRLRLHVTMHAFGVRSGAARVVYAAGAGSGGRGSGCLDRQSHRRVSCAQCVSQCVTMFGAVELVLVCFVPDRGESTKVNSFFYSRGDPSACATRDYGANADEVGGGRSKDVD